MVDLPKGAKQKLKDLKDLAASNPDLQSLSQDKKDELIAALVEHRERKKAGARPSHRAAAQDVRATLERIESEVCTPSHTHRLALTLSLADSLTRTHRRPRLPVRHPCTRQSLCAAQPCWIWRLVGLLRTSTRGGSLGRHPTVRAVGLQP